MRLKLDPYAYVQGDKGKCKIIMVWVDDLLLFTSSAQLCEQMKKDLQSEWEITDLGEPAKIIDVMVLAGQVLLDMSEC